MLESVRRWLLWNESERKGDGREKRREGWGGWREGRGEGKKRRGIEGRERYGGEEELKWKFGGGSCQILINNTFLLTTSRDGRASSRSW